jgi:hypothetical protein
MPPPNRNLEKNLQKLLGGPAAARIRGQMSNQALRKLEDQATAALFRQRKMNWVNDPKTRKGVLVERGTGKIIVRSNGEPFQRARITKIAPELVIETFRDFAAQTGVEGYVPWMYLDNKGNPTVGIGHKLSGLTEAQELNFVVRDQDRVATGPTFIPRVHPKHIENAYDLVLARPDLMDDERGGFAYEEVSHIDLTADEIERLFREDVEQKIREIKAEKEFEDFDSFPQLAKLGFLDVAFNAGVGKILQPKEARGFPDFTDAVRRRDWKSAGDESFERENKIRAEIARQWFREAARLDPFFIAKPRETKRWDVFLQ